jgi:hypothetical protein
MPMQSSSGIFISPPGALLFFSSLDLLLLRR